MFVKACVCHLETSSRSPTHNMIWKCSGSGMTHGMTMRLSLGDTRDTLGEEANEPSVDSQSITSFGPSTWRRTCTEESSEFNSWNFLCSASQREERSAAAGPPCGGQNIGEGGRSSPSQHWVCIGRASAAHLVMTVVGLETL